MKMKTKRSSSLAKGRSLTKRVFRPSYAKVVVVTSQEGLPGEGGASRKPDGGCPVDCFETVIVHEDDHANRASLYVERHLKEADDSSAAYRLMTESFCGDGRSWDAYTLCKENLRRVARLNPPRIVVPQKRGRGNWSVCRCCWLHGDLSPQLSRWLEEKCLHRRQETPSWVKSDAEFFENNTDCLYFLRDATEEEACRFEQILDQLSLCAGSLDASDGSEWESRMLVLRLADPMRCRLPILMSTEGRCLAVTGEEGGSARFFDGVFDLVEDFLRLVYEKIQLSVECCHACGVPWRYGDLVIPVDSGLGKGREWLFCPGCVDRTKCSPLGLPMLYSGVGPRDEEDKQRYQQNLKVIEKMERDVEVMLLERKEEVNV